MIRAACTSAATALALATMMAASHAAQPYPGKPIRVLVPFAAGGGTDALARMVAQRMTDALGQPVIVDNRPAVDGVVASELTARAVSDGYTLMLISSSHAINPALRGKLPYDTIRDFLPITQTANQQLLFVVHPSVPAKNVKELIDHAKANPDKLNYGSSSNAVALPMELFKTMSGTKIQHVPYKGSAPMVNDLLGGQIQMAIAGAVSAIPQVKAGRLRALAIGDSKRSAFLPEVPTIAESGVPGYQASIWSGMLAPARTPRAIIDLLNQTAVKVVLAAEFKERLLTMGSDAVGSTPEEWGRFIESEMVKWAKIVQATGMKAE